MININSAMDSEEIIFEKLKKAEKLIIPINRIYLKQVHLLINDWPWILNKYTELIPSPGYALTLGTEESYAKAVLEYKRKPYNERFLHLMGNGEVSFSGDPYNTSLMDLKKMANTIATYDHSKFVEQFSKVKYSYVRVVP